MGPGSRLPDAPSKSRGVLRISPFTRIVGFAPPFNGPDGKGPMSGPPGRKRQSVRAGRTAARPPFARRTTACLDRSSGRRSGDRFHERRRGPRADPPPAARSVAAPPPVDDVLHRRTTSTRRIAATGARTRHSRGRRFRRGSARPAGACRVDETTRSIACSQLSVSPTMVSPAICAASSASRGTAQLPVSQSMMPDSSQPPRYSRSCVRLRAALCRRPPPRRRSSAIASSLSLGK